MSKSLKNIGVISFLTAVSRVLGLFRDSVQLAIFGAGEVMSAFTTANIAPNLFRRLLAEGSMTAAFIPTLQEELHLNGKEGTFRLVSKVSSWLLVITGSLCVAAMLFFSESRSLFPGHDDKWYLASDLTVLLFPYLALISLSAAFSATLNVLQRFFEPALSPIWLNLSVLGGLGFAGMHYAKSPVGAIHWLCAGWLIGGFCQMIVPALVLMYEGWRPNFDLGLSPRVREIARLMTPGIFGTAIYQINFSVSRLLAFSLDDSSATFLYAVNRLMEFPIGVFAVAVSTVIYPLIARHAVKSDFASMAKDFQKGIRLILIINVPAAAGLALLSGPIVSLLFRHGQVTPDEAHKMGFLLAVMAIALPFFSVVSLMIRAFYAIKDTKTPVRIAVVDFIINIAVSLILIRILGLLGIVLASTTAIIVQAVLLERALVKRLPEMHFAPLIPSVLKVLASAAIMSGILWAGMRAVHAAGLAPAAANLVQVVGLIPLGVGAYGLCLWLMKIEGVDELRVLLGKLPGVGRLLRPAL
ncbi:MAG TPA: murein biosynthesis integral membrane protein MurJ [Opitutaceae bacterium]|nr:murein biosynthesis integral membrane protein MurJ [Opitutaceae bacterium]